MAGSQVRYTFDDIIHHKDSVMAEAIEMGRTAATSSLSVLITGESGTGKELFAQAIPRRKRQKKRALCGHRLRVHAPGSRGK